MPGVGPIEALGNDDSGRKYAWLDAAERPLSSVREIILAVDGDQPGADLLADLALHIAKSWCRWLR